MGKKKKFDLLLQSFVLKQLPLPFLNTAQAVSGGLGLNAATIGYRTGNTLGWDISEMHLMPGRHSKCLKHSIRFFSFALVFWNISWLTVICSAFESFSLKRGTAVLLLPQTSEKCFFSTSFLLQQSTSGLTHPSLSDTCPISSFPFSPTDLICCLQNKSRRQVLIYLFTNWVSQQQGVSSYCRIYKHRKWWGLKPFWQNLALSIHKQAAYGINLASNIHQGRTNMLKSFFPLTFRLLLLGLLHVKHLFFILFLPLLAFPVSSGKCYSFWNHLKEDSGIQVQTLTIMGYKTVTSPINSLQSLYH